MFQNNAIAAVELGELKSSPEKADTRILLHAKYASGYKLVILLADDTDILLLCLRYSNIYIKSSKSWIRLIAVKKSWNLQNREGYATHLCIRLQDAIQ